MTGGLVDRREGVIERTAGLTMLLKTPWVGEGEILRFFALLRMTSVGGEAVVNPTSIAVGLRLRWGTRTVVVG